MAFSQCARAYTLNPTLPCPTLPLSPRALSDSSIIPAAGRLCLKFEHSRLQRQRDSEIISDKDYTDGKQFIIKEVIELYETAKRRHLEPEMSSPATPLRSPSSAASEGTPSPALPP